MLYCIESHGVVPTVLHIPASAGLARNDGQEATDEHVRGDQNEPSLQRAGTLSTLEPNVLCRNDQKRPDGLTRFPIKFGKSLCRDNTCADTLSQTNMLECDLEAGAEADQAEKDKRANYREIPQRYLFEPMVVESTGVYSPSIGKLINTISSRIPQGLPIHGKPRG